MTGSLQVFDVIKNEVSLDVLKNEVCWMSLKNVADNYKRPVSNNQRTCITTLFNFLLEK